MTRLSISFAVLAAFVGGVAATSGLAGSPPTQDSGRYGFNLSCRNIPDFIECAVVARDLEYNTVLVDTILTASVSASLGGGVSFEGHPARGARQRITLALHSQGTYATPERAMLDVHIHERGHLIQRYSLTFPVTHGHECGTATAVEQTAVLPESPPE